MHQNPSGPSRQNMYPTLLLILTLLSFPSSPHSTAGAADPLLLLSTSGRWIVDQGGRRVKLACANWAAHLESASAEGLGRQPLDYISKQVVSMGFNCVRLTWPTVLATNASVSSLTLRSSLLELDLKESAAGAGVNNPGLIDIPLIQVFQAVVSNLARNSLMVILDNQITKPMWCCSRYDGNGFFGDQYFDPDEWLQGLKMIATMFQNSTNVVGMSLRNELRGPKQNVSEWYRYMQKGAEVVHAANPNVLVILSGLDYDKDLSFLTDKQVELSFSGKLVFELHWYGFSDGGDWENGNPNEVCAGVVGNMTRKGFFLLQQGWPLFLSEFGVEVRGDNEANNRFLSCFLSIAVELDLDWAIWALQGSYYTREGQLSFDETYGVLSWDWCKPRNSSFLQRIAVLQSPFQGPGLTNVAPYSIIFHPLTGRCVRKKSSSEMLELAPCVESKAWDYTVDDEILLKGTGFCLQAGGIGKPVKVGVSCGDYESKWELISVSKMHIASKILQNGGRMCLDIGSDGTVVMNLCKCLTYNGTSDPESQWFKIISSNRDIEEKDRIDVISPRRRIASMLFPRVGRFEQKIVQK